MKEQEEIRRDKKGVRNMASNKRVQMRVDKVNNREGIVMVYSIRERKSMWVTTEALLNTMAYKQLYAQILNVVLLNNMFYAIIDGKKTHIHIYESIPQQTIDLAAYSKDCESNTRIWKAKKEAKVVKRTSIEELNRAIDRRANKQLEKELNDALMKVSSLSVTGREIDNAKTLNKAYMDRKLTMSSKAELDKLAKSGDKQQIDAILEKMDKKIRMDKRDEMIRKRREQLKAEEINEDFLGVTKGKRKVTTELNQTYGNEFC